MNSNQPNSMTTTPTSVLGNSQIPNLPAHMTSNRKATFSQRQAPYQPQQQQLSSHKTKQQQQSQAQSLRALLKDQEVQLPSTLSAERPATFTDNAMSPHRTTSPLQKTQMASSTASSQQPLNAPKGPRRKQRLNTFNKSSAGSMASQQRGGTGASSTHPNLQNQKPTTTSVNPSSRKIKDDQNVNSLGKQLPRQVRKTPSSNYNPGKTSTNFNGQKRKTNSRVPSYVEQQSQSSNLNQMQQWTTTTQQQREQSFGGSNISNQHLAPYDGCCSSSVEVSYQNTSAAAAQDPSSQNQRWKKQLQLQQQSQQPRPKDDSSLFVGRQETSDCLDVSEENHEKIMEGFNSARTHLSNFQVRKSPILGCNVDTVDGKSSPGGRSMALQIPKATAESAKKMFSHPYGGQIEMNSVDESTRRNTTRYAGGGDSSSNIVRRMRIGSHDQASFGAKAAEIVEEVPQETQQHQSLTQSLFSALGSLVSRGSSASKPPNSHREAQSGSLSASQRRNTQQLQSSQTYTQEKSGALYSRKAADQEQNLIKIQETTEPILTDHYTQRLENDRAAQSSLGQMETDENGLVVTTQMCGFATENSIRLNKLKKFGLNLLPVPAGRRNEILKTQTCMNGFSSFSGSRSPMKSRKFTKPAQKPQEDDIVESMNIITMDMVEERKQIPPPLNYNQAAMNISEGDEQHQPPPYEECKGCPDCNTQNSGTDQGYCGDDRYQQYNAAPMVQQQTTTLNPQTATVCSCSGCMASQTAYMPQENTQETSRPTRICLETVLTECEQIRALFTLLSQPKFNQVMLLDQKKILLERIQTYCEEWWGASSQFHNLNAVFEQDGTAEGQQISSQIKKSQVVLCVTIGLIAALSIEVQSSYLDSLVISQTFQCPRMILQDAYAVQMKLTSIILSKMDREERLTNEFAVKLQERINRFREEFNADLIFADDNSSLQNSVGSDENNRELKHVLNQRIQHQIEMLEQQCKYRPLPKAQLTLYENLLTITAEIYDLNIAKDLIANEVNAIQESSTAMNAAQDQSSVRIDAEQLPHDSTSPSQNQQQSSNNNPSYFVRPPALQVTPQMSESAGSLGACDSMPAGTRPIDIVIQEKQRELATGAYLSEICEEPRSTEQNVSPSVEPEISRISSTRQEDSGLGSQPSASNMPQLNRKESSSQHTRQEREEEALVCMEQIIDIENVDSDDAAEATKTITIESSHAAIGMMAANATLPPSTRPYSLVLDLDETLIHSHVQYKKRLETRAQQQQYFRDLAQRFASENGREPTKEELENMALEMVFNIRPFAEEFLNTMAKEFEIIVFTAGEQDYADEILNTLDQDRAITHRLYRQHTLQVKDVQSGATKHYIKDLERTGRDLSKTIIIDNIKENFCRQPRNGIQITTWKDDAQDTELMYLQRLLLNMARQHPEDVRDKLDLFKQHDLLPQHFDEPIEDESSSFQHFEPVVVASADTSLNGGGSTAKKTGKHHRQQSNDASSSNSRDNLLTVEKSKQQQRNSDHSMVSIESGRSSVRQKSVANSSFQKRRLSQDSLKDEEYGGIRRNGQRNNGEDGEIVVDYDDAECFFVDDVPVHVELKESTECLTKQFTHEDGNIEHEQGRSISYRQTTQAYYTRGEGDSSVVSLYNEQRQTKQQHQQQQLQASTQQDPQRNNAFVETSSSKQH